MTDIWMTCQLIANWLSTNNIKASPKAVLQLTNLILQALENMQERAYQQGQHNARKEIDGCKQP